MKRYYIKNGAISFADCSINYTEYSCDNPKHQHEGIELVYVISGRGENIINGKCVKAKRGSLIIMNHNCIHTINIWETMKYYNIMFRPTFIDKYLDENDSLNVLLKKAYSYDYDEDFLAVDFEDEETIQKVNELFYGILDEGIKKEIRCADIICCRVNEIINMMLRKADSSVTAADDRFFEDVMKYIKENGNEPLTLTDTAKKFNYEPDYFSKKLKRTCGMTFSQIVLNKKLSEVVSDLIMTKDSIDEIIHRRGFTNKTHFYSLFEKNYGIKPKFVREYQNNYRKYLELQVKHREQLDYITQ